MLNEALTPRQIVAELDKYIVGQKPLNVPWPLRFATVIAEAAWTKRSAMKSCRKIF